MADPKNGGSTPPLVPLADNAILCRVHKWGPNSFVLTLDAEIRRQMGIVQKDVLAFRVMMWKGRRVMIGEKVPLSALANVKALPSETTWKG